ncbi:NUDIX domain-containing protein [Nanoarchaeota archaeon]
MGEQIDIYNKIGNKIGTKDRLLAHLNADWHEVVQVWVFNKDKRILTQKRSKDKLTYPGQEDFCFGGHITSGSNNVETAVNEIEEEIGLNIKQEDLIYFGTNNFSLDIPHKDVLIKDREIQHLYGLEYNGKISDLEFKDKEVESVQYRSIIECTNILENLKESNKLMYDSVIDLCNRMFENILNY